MSDMKIGFIGLGAMGAPMAARLAQAGYALWLYDVDAKRTAEIAENLKAQAVASPRDMAAHCNVIITMLPNSAIVKTLCDEELFPNVAKGTIFLDMTSGDPIVTKEIAQTATSLGLHFLDAPVSGGVPRATTGELAIMVGGETDGGPDVRPILSQMGRSIVATGEAGSAHAMKALNNLVSAGGFLITVEALLIGQRFGLDPALMVDVLNVSTGMNNTTQKKIKEYVLSRQFNAGFGLDLMAKDIGIALSLANDTETDTPFAQLCRTIWDDAKANLGSGRDHTEIARHCESLVAGTELSFQKGDAA